jgi:RNA-directed DNA polymerase
VDFSEFSERFRIEATRRGHSQSYIEKCLAYAGALIRAGLPIIFDVAHLAASIGTDESLLRHVAATSAEMYFTFRIPKARGGMRRIDQPQEPLSTIQYWILRNILNHSAPSPWATAFVHGRSILGNATPHVGKRYVLSLDIENFFSSIRPKLVFRAFRQLGYARDLSVILTRLTVHREGLPQGAPTSPSISNLVLKPFDVLVGDFSMRNRISYSRYADDLTFSGDFSPGLVVTEVRRCLKFYALRLNESKTRLMQRHQRQEVTGLVVNSKVSVPRSIRRQIRQEQHYIQRFGVESHESFQKSLHGNRLAHLRGLAEFVLSVQSENRDAKALVQTIGRWRASPTRPEPVRRSAPTGAPQFLQPLGKPTPK